jgi:hypothetical protein
MLVDTGATVSIVSNDIYQKIPDVARPALTSTNQEVLTVSGQPLRTYLPLERQMKLQYYPVYYSDVL